MGKIAEDTIQQVAAANDIVDVIGGYFPLKRAGSAYRALCPFHVEKTPSFHVNPHRQIYHCFGCGAGGSVFRFVMEYEHVDFPTAVRRLAERAGIRIVEEEFSPGEQQKVNLRRRLLSLHQEAAKWFHQLLMKSPAGGPARDYLRGRGINSAIAAAWQIGYAPDSWDAFSHWAESQGFKSEEVRQSGLVSTREEHAENYYDRFRHRVMFPICNDIGEVIAFSGRTLETDPQSAKYVNSSETPLFSKGNVLFGLHKSKRALIGAKSAIVCEGQLDLITAFENGVQNVIAPQGTAFTANQARILRRLVEEVVLCFDADAAGMKAAERSLPALLELGLFVRVAEMPAGQDPDSLIRGEGADAFRRQIDQAKDFFDYQIDRHATLPEFRTPRGKTAFARKMAGWVGLVGDPVLGDTLVNRVTARLELSGSEFRRLIPRRGADLPAEEPERREAVEMTPTMRLLCLAALRDGEARQRMRRPEWAEGIRDVPGADLLARILEADLDPQNPASVNAFAASLDPESESLVAELLVERAPDNFPAMLDDCLRGLERDRLKRRQEEIASRLRLPDLSEDEQIQLMKEVIDLKKRSP